MSTPATLPHWVLETARLPIAFAQVREDSLLDLKILDRIQTPHARGIMIASGGCTAASLAASGRLSHLHLVDFNSAQMALCRLKLHLLNTADPPQRLQLMGHSPSPAASRAIALADCLQTLGLEADALGSPQLVAEWGPDYVGRYEILFAKLRGRLQNFYDDLVAVLTTEDPHERAEQVAPHTLLGQALDAAFDEAMSLPILVHLFGSDATQNSRQPFSRHFAGRTRHAIATLPTANNPYLWQLLLGRFSPRKAYPWFTAVTPRQMPEIITTVGTIDATLSARKESFDFVHLSNVLDWLSPDHARRTLQLALDALRTDGYVIIRQLNSTLDLPELAGQFEWLKSEANQLHAMDRSFFYRSLHVGRKR